MAISLRQVSYTYQVGTPFEQDALFQVDMEVADGSYTAIIGHTGSGKSTLLQLLNGLHLPTAGSLCIEGVELDASSELKALKHLRQKVGLVFQFPESQLFEETVLKDVAFGPQNFGVAREEAERIARDKLRLVGIPEDVFGRSPFELSGGQMRRVAIAGILAMEPSVLVLDEPTAGLDPAGRTELLAIFQQLHQAGMTIVLVTHVMDDVAQFADYVYVMDQGRVVREGDPRAVFQEVAFLESIQLGVPKVTGFAHRLAKKGMVFDHLPIRIEELTEVLGRG